MKTLIIKFQYDGTNFSGWQYQPQTRTVQEELQKGFKKRTGLDLKFTASGRTDKGVHAREQIASAEVGEIKIPDEKIPKAVNSMLPNDIRVIEAQTVEEEFNARFNAEAREYTYYVTSSPDIFKRHYYYHMSFDLDIDKMNEAAEIFKGRHDFTTFSKLNIELENYESDVQHCVWKRINETDIKLEIRANRFVYAMVRSLVGTMIDVGRGKRDIEEVKEALKEQNRDRCSKIAPPHGLFFERVYYESDIDILEKLG